MKITHDDNLVRVTVECTKAEWADFKAGCIRAMMMFADMKDHPAKHGLTVEAEQTLRRQWTIFRDLGNS